MAAHPAAAWRFHPADGSLNAAGAGYEYPMANQFLFVLRQRDQIKQFG
jgi:hypothetical protein